MKVKDLIADLQEYNPEAKLTFATSRGDLEMLSMYSGDLAGDGWKIYVKEKPLTDPDVCIDLGGDCDD